MRQLLSIGLLLFFGVSQAVFATSVWQVSKDQTQFYLVGTVHLLSENDFPLPNAFDTAFNASQHLIFETDMQQLTSPAGMNKMMSQNTYRPGQNLKDVLSNDVYQQLQAMAKERQWPLTAIEQFKPAFAAMMISVQELQRLGAASTGVDMHYLQLGLQQQKRISGLETVDEHLAVLTALNEIDANKVISSTLQDLEKIESMLAQMKAAWRSGHAEQLADLYIDDMKKTPEIYQITLAKRNYAWLDTLTQLEGKDTMVLVGALHMVGEDGLLKLLADRGYRIEQLHD
ncbi:TraB/GumN family protein [Alishewanella sp. 16-MA]|uniref:TraB/GumN family protein n=1 Tax=Alishewanella maricola TaxID=2795740 RepID=A0ABS8C0S7_9ALTE|nr:TraB/GumN family protein [Alishewanella maricola]MCB5225735.1 TraB/GumN family protein [Alishewanella maricola]